MKLQSYSNRTGGFTSINQGTIRDCFTEAKVKHPSNIAGFVFENSGDVLHSLALKKTKGKENVAGFCCRNRGKLNASGYLLRLESTPEPEEGASRAPESTFKKKKKSDYVDEKLALRYTDLAELMRSLDFGRAWVVVDSAKGKLDHDRGFTYHSFPLIEGEEIIEISDAQHLLQIASDIATGDAQAASAHYRLAADINLGGKKMLPIGLSETVPFTGIFDGAGHKVHNFKVAAKGLEFAGLFGYIKGGTVANLDIDCVVNAKGGMVTGGLCGVNGGHIYNCRVLAKVNAEKSCGGFCGKNYGTIEASSFIGAIVPALPIWIYILPLSLLLLLLLAAGAVFMILELTKSPYEPIVIDPGSVPVLDDTPVDPPPAGTSRISINLNQEIYVNVTPDPASGLQAGIADCVNPKRSTEDIVMSIWVSDAELIAKGIENAGFTAEEYAVRSSAEGYNAKTAYQELYRSGRIPIGYQVEVVGLTALPNGTYLPLGDYEMKVVIDPYNPETNEKSVVNAEAPVTVHVVESVTRG